MSIFSRRTAPQRSATTQRNRVRPHLRAVNGTIAPAAPALTASARPVSLPFSTHRNLTAAASIIDISSAEERASYTKRRAGNSWQDEAWYYSKNIGEIGYAFTVVANALSRVRLYAAQSVDPTTQPIPADPDSHAGQAAIEALNRLNSAYGGVPGLLRDAAMNIQISGECLLVQRPANPFVSPPQPESWDIRSAHEIQVDSSGNFVLSPREDGDKSAQSRLPKNAFIARIWRPDPQFSDDPTSSMRPLLDLCAESLLLNKTYRATARSRLNSGLLYLPDGLSVAASPDPDPGDIFPESDEAEETSHGMAYDAGDQSDVDEFEEALIEAMLTPIADEESASAVVPLIVRGPADLGEKIKLIQFERSFDPALAERGEIVMQRIMQGLDVPKEIVQGLSALKFSTAQIVDIQLFQTHVEPLALLICDALTTVYLRPALRALGLPEDEISQFVIWYDATDVTTRPNRAEDAEKGYGDHLLSGSAWRKAHNFTDEDAPTTTELALRMLLEDGNLTPELTEALLTVMAPEVMKAVRESTQEASPAPLTPDIQDALDGNPAPEPEEPAEEPAPEPETPAAPPVTPPAPDAPGTNETQRPFDNGDFV